jgi:flagellin-specific chaperone FliS
MIHTNNMENMSGADLLILSLDMAVRYIGDKDMAKAKGIIVNIMAALDFKYPISYRLLALYEYILEIINAADVLKYNEAINILTGLRAAWQYADRVNRRQARCGAMLIAGLTYGAGGLDTYAAQDETGGFFV